MTQIINSENNFTSFYLGSVGGSEQMSDWITWDKPKDAKFVYIVAVPGGSGGAGGFCSSVSGYYNNVYSIKFDFSALGGMGGNNGGHYSLFMPAMFLPNKLYIKLGYGGSGGLGHKFGTSYTTSNIGGAGGNTRISFYPNDDNFNNILVTSGARCYVKNYSPSNDAYGNGGRLPTQNTIPYVYKNYGNIGRYVDSPFMLNFYNHAGLGKVSYLWQEESAIYSSITNTDSSRDDTFNYAPNYFCMAWNANVGQFIFNNYAVENYSDNTLNCRGGDGGGVSSNNSIINGQSLIGFQPYLPNLSGGAENVEGVNGLGYIINVINAIQNINPLGNNTLPFVCTGGTGGGPSTSGDGKNGGHGGPGSGGGGGGGAIPVSGRSGGNGGNGGPGFVYIVCV